MKNRRSRIFWFLLGCVFLFIIAFLIHYQYKFHSDFTIQSYDKQLQELARQSLLHNDVPVSSLLLYDNKIIGQGYNTVLRDTNPAGHAEINALKDALKSIGPVKFKTLDRNKLVLISTFEPCPMCKGTLNEYNISHVVFSLAKPISDKFIQLKKQLKYNSHLRETGNGRLQYDLFNMHLDFDSTKFSF